MRLKALAEIYTMHSFAPFSNLNLSSKIAKNFRDWIIEFPIVFIFCVEFAFFCEFLMKFCPDFATNSRAEWRVPFFQSNLRKQIRNLQKILKSVKIVHYYILALLIIVHLCPWWGRAARARPDQGPRLGAAGRGLPRRPAPRGRGGRRAGGWYLCGN